MDQSGNLTMTGNISGNYILGTYFNASLGNSENPTIGQIWTQNTTDNYLRKSTPAHFRSQITDGVYVYTRGQSNWNDSTVINNVVGLLAWKNYGNAHVIFDASQGTSPSGGGVSQTNATNAWTATFPTLMGWNGSQTYGVRVDSARVADSASAASSVSASSSTGITSSYSTTINTTTPGTATYGINFAGSSIADNASGITWAWSGNAAQAGIYVQSSGSYGTKMYLATTDSFATGAKTSVSIDHLGNTNIIRGALQQQGNQVLHAGNFTSYALPVNGNWIGNTGMNDQRLFLRTNGDLNHYLWNAADDWEELNAYEGTGFRITSNTGSTGVLYVYGSSNGGYTYSPYSFRAPIFYDSQDTTYYLDPNSTISAIFRGSVGLNNTSPINTAWGDASNTVQLSITGSGHSVINLRGGSRTYSMGSGSDIFYMCYDNTASRHNLNVYSDGRAEFARSVVIGRNSSTNSYDTASLGQLYFGSSGSDSPQYYNIATNLENFNGNYTKLDFLWYTGQRFYAHNGYGGFRFKEITGGQATLFSIGEGDLNVRVTNNLIVGNNITYPGAITYTGSAGSTALNLATNDGYASMRVIRNNMASSPFNDGMYIGYANASSGITRIFGGGSTGGGIAVNGGGVNDVTIAGNVVLNAGNYNSYSPTLTGGGASGTWGINITGNAGTSTGTYNIYYNALGTGSMNISTGASGVYRNENGNGGNLAYAPVLHLAASDTMWQIQGDYYNSSTLQWRAGYAGNWYDWRQILHSANYNSYAPTLTGGGASGTWNISITGSAGSASSATFLNSSNYINQTGSTGSWNADFQNTPAGTARYGGDVGANQTNGPGGSWWIQQNFRHTNSSNFWGIQVAWGWEDNANRLATRNVTGGNFGGWVYYMNTAAYPIPASMNQYVRTSDTVRFDQARFSQRISIGDGNGTPFLNTGSPGIWLSYNGNSDIFMGAQSSTTWGVYIGSWLLTLNNSGAVTATSFFESSDFRLKSEIKDLDVDVSSIVAKSYLKNGIEEIGYIAQDVESILPSAILKRENGYLDLSYRQIHTAKIAALEKRILYLEQQLKNK
jgi:hypothetical protein